MEIFIPKCKSKIGKIVEIYTKVINYNSSKAFLHFMPNDVIGYCVFTKIHRAKKYYIVHNDHTFWLGKNCSDIFIEFRNIGIYLSIYYRNIKIENIVKIPYYPINDNNKFRGFPIIKNENTIIGLTAAQLYKYLEDPKLRYFDAISLLLERNKNFIFYLVGWGNKDEEKVIRKYINNSKVKSRFIFLGRRNDFNEVIKNIDILFESYPLRGGLTLLYAIANKKAVVGIGNENTMSGVTEDFLSINGYKQPRNIEEFIKEAELLINNEKYRIENVNILGNNKYNKEDFDKALNKLLSSKPLDMEYFERKYNLNMNKILKEYLVLKDYEVTLYLNKYKLLYKNYYSIFKIFFTIKYYGINSFLVDIIRIIKRYI